MTNKPTHTPTPWKTHEARQGVDPVIYISGEKRGVATIINGNDFLMDETSKANAAFIVTACNAYAPIVELLKEIHILHKELNISEHLDGRIQKALRMAGEVK